MIFFPLKTDKNVGLFRYTKKREGTEALPYDMPIFFKF